ncbi:hypothetical protein J6590_082499 [Homalodisca vitripennis]|nr:hypothetical protein J6590_082499 [Homalodisca vitripennis]
MIEKLRNRSCPVLRLIQHIVRIILSGEIRVKNPSLPLNLRTNGLKLTSEPPPIAGQAGCSQGQDRPSVTHPSSGHALRCLNGLSCDNSCARYTTQLENLHWCVGY